MLEVRTAPYGPGIDQSQHAKSVSHIIKSLNLKGAFFLVISNFRYVEYFCGPRRLEIREDFLLCSINLTRCVLYRSLEPTAGGCAGLQTESGRPGQVVQERGGNPGLQESYYHTDQTEATSTWP